MQEDLTHKEEKRASVELGNECPHALLLFSSFSSPPPLLLILISSSFIQQYALYTPTPLYHQTDLSIYHFTALLTSSSSSPMTSSPALARVETCLEWVGGWVGG